MRDPDLVQRAERAALALERAWGRWRTMHGLGSDPLPPVSSYVGYSLEEPWGQPRVVFGVRADEAERLAALLDGHDCVGPVHAELTGRPDWRRTPGSDPSFTAHGLDAQFTIPAQASQPAADMFASASQADIAAATGVGTTGTVDSPAKVAAHATPVPEVDVAGGTVQAGGTVHSGSAVQPGRAMAQQTPADAPASAVRAGGVEDADLEAADVDAAHLEASDVGAADVEAAVVDAGGIETADVVAGDVTPDGGGQPEPTVTISESRSSGKAASPVPRPPTSRRSPAGPPRPAKGRGRGGNARQLAEGPQPGDQAEPAGAAAELPEIEQPGIVAFRPRPDQQPGAAVESEPLAPLPTMSGDEGMPNQGPGYRGPRYQGYPPRYEAAKERDQAGPESAHAPEADSGASAAAIQPAHGKARQLSRLGRTRRKGPGAHEAWDSEAEQSAADHAV